MDFDGITYGAPEQPLSDDVRETASEPAPVLPLYLADKLQADGYDGLCCDDCGCGVDDLIPCCDFVAYCRPAYKWTCADCDGLTGPDGERLCDGEDGADGCWRDKPQPTKGGTDG